MAKPKWKPKRKRKPSKYAMKCPECGAFMDYWLNQQVWFCRECQWEEGYGENKKQG